MIGRAKQISTKHHRINDVDGDGTKTRSTETKHTKMISEEEEENR
jgi:hypothetical protein